MQVNLGERVLRGLLCRWRERHAALVDGARTSQLEQVRVYIYTCHTVRVDFYSLE
jgi:hypothetical protein